MEDLERLAIRQRLDLAASAQAVRTVARQLAFSRSSRWFRQGGLGVSAEREVEGEWVIGPGIDVELPIFDQGQAGIRRESARFRQRERMLAALAVAIRSHNSTGIPYRGCVRSSRSARMSASKRCLYSTGVMAIGGLLS